MAPVHRNPLRRSRGARAPAGALLLLLWSFVAAGCGSARFFLEPDELREFQLAGPVTPELDRAALMRSIPPPGPYRVDSGDLLEIHGPPALLTPSAATAGAGGTVHLTRVDKDGKVQVPLAGAIDVRGRTLLEIEAAIADAVHPQFLVDRPAVVARVAEHRRVPVTVIGAVEDPGVHELRSDQLTLFGALSEAGGILKSTNLVVGARLIRVRPRDERVGTDIVLPVRGLNVPFSDVRLLGGETIEVERYEPDTFTVIGLVTKPGAYEYPPEVTYNLMQALAVAGGVDIIADPPYATVFRKADDGRILPATFEISGNALMESSGLAIKPGDVIVVDHTTATWSRSLLARILSIQFGFFVDERGNN